MNQPLSPGGQHQGGACAWAASASHTRQPGAGEAGGLVIDPLSQHIRSLVMDVVDAAGTQQVELPMVPFRLDAESHALRMVKPHASLMTAFQAESVSQIDKTICGFQSSTPRPDNARRPLRSRP